MGDPLDARADLYALGVMLYKMLRGQLPFRGPSSMAVTAKHLHESPPPLRSPNSARPIPQEFRALVHRLLAKQPEERPSSAGEVTRALMEINADTPGSKADDTRQLALTSELPEQLKTSERADASELPARRRGKSIALRITLGALLLLALMLVRTRDEARPSQPVDSAISMTRAADAPEFAPAPSSAAPPLVDPQEQTNKSATTTGAALAPSTTTSSPNVDAPATPTRPPTTRALVDELGRASRRAVKRCADDTGAWTREIPTRVRLDKSGRVRTVEFPGAPLKRRFQACLTRALKSRRVSAPGERRTIELTLSWRAGT